MVADAQTLQEENLSEKGSVESARRLVKSILEAAKLLCHHQYMYNSVCFAKSSFSVAICIFVPGTTARKLSVHLHSNSCLILAPLLKVMLEVAQNALVTG